MLHFKAVKYNIADVINRYVSTNLKNMVNHPGSSYRKFGKAYKVKHFRIGKIK